MQRVFPSLFGKIREIELTMHSVEKMLILFHRKKFRQISSLVVFSKNVNEIFEKNVKENFCNFHTVVWKLRKFTLILF